MTDLLDNRYNVKRLLGEGAMGRVYLAEDVLTRQEVALKVVSPTASGEKTLLQLKQEFRLMTRLRHPHCCAVYSYGVLAEGEPYFTMEVVPGHGLDELLPLDAGRTRQILAELLLALGYVHQLGFVYRDLKPANVRVRTDGTVKLMDFGLMDLAGRAAGTIAGTLPYISPEMARRGPVDQRSDLYSLGCLAYELLTGQPPFIRPTPLEMLRAHANEQPLPPSAHTPGLDPEVEAVVMRLLAKEPTERFQSASEVLTALGHEAPAGIGGNLLASPLVGRQAELAQLEARLEAVSDGCSGGTLLLWGPAGAGKTRLVEELRYAAELKPMPFAMGKAYESGNFPYRHFVWVLRSLLPAMRTQIPEALAELAPTLVKLLPELGAEPAPELEPSQEKARLQSAVVDALVALASRQGFVIVLENWQWADPLSIELLEHLLRNMQLAPILLVVSSRLAHEGATGGLAEVERLAVGPLSPEAIAAMATGMLGEREVAGSFLTQIGAFSEGNPLYVERLLEHLVKHGTLVRAGGRWQTELQLTREALPADLAGLLADALANLGSEAVTLARAAAVIGRVFDLELLARVSGLPEDQLFDASTELMQRQVFVPGEAEAYGFKQEAYHEHFYAQVEPEARVARHAAALEVLEERLGQTPPLAAPLELVTALARHALITGRTDRAVRYALAAGLRNARLFANAEAEEFLLAGLRQIEAAPGDRWRDEKLQYLEALGNVRRVLGDKAGAQATLESALPLAEAAGDRLAAGRMRTSLAKVYSMRDRNADALTACEQALADCRAAGARGEAARCLLTRSRLHYYAGRVGEAIADAEQGLALAREATDEVQTGTALGFLGYLKLTQGPEQAKEGIALLEQAVSIHDALGDKVGLQTALDYLGNAQLMRGELPQARETFLKKNAICQEVGYRTEEAFGRVNLALIALEQGRFPMAQRLAEEAGSEAAALNSQVPLSFARLLEAAASARLGQVGRAVKLAAEAESIAEALGNQYLTAQMLPHQIDWRLFLGRLDEARTVLDALKALLAASPMADVQAVYALHESAYHAARGEAGQAKEALETALELAEASQAQGLVARARASFARLAIAREDWEAARTDAEKALEAADALEMRGLSAELSGLLGEIALATGQPAKAHFERMADMAEASGSRLLQGLAAFGLAAADAYAPEAAGRVRGARDHLEAFMSELDPPGTRAFLEPKERRRAFEGNHIDFSLSKTRSRNTGPLPALGTGPLGPPGMWR